MIIETFSVEEILNPLQMTNFACVFLAHITIDSMLVFLAEQILL